MLQKTFYLSCILMLSANCLSAQYTDVINSNRPGASEGAFAVGTNVLQFEVGATTIKEEHSRLQYEVSGFGLDFSIRYGLLFEQLEVLLVGAYQNDTFTDLRGSLSQSEFDRANFRSFTLGAKYLIFDPYKNREDNPNLYSYHANRRLKWRDLLPAVSIYAGANFDSADSPYVPPGVEGISPRIRLLTQHNFNGGWVFVTNFVLDRIGTDFTEFQYIITLTHSFDPKWSIFGETQGIKSDFYADNLFRFGGAYLWNKDFQLDTAITFNTKDTPTVFSFSFGASYRLDFHRDKKINNNNSAKEEAKRTSRRKKKKNKKAEDFEEENF